jgi:hypothetical protein
LLIVGFTYFYVSITFNPEEISDNMKRYGGFIPGIRAGRPTTEFLDYVLSRITAAGAIYLGLIALIPLVAFALIGTNQNFPFGGTSILIIVGVGLATVKQISAQMEQRNYEGLLTADSDELVTRLSLQSKASRAAPTTLRMLSASARLDVYEEQTAPLIDVYAAQRPLLQGLTDLALRLAKSPPGSLQKCSDARGLSFEDA